MKKTFNINIAGSVFTIDDDAYALLDDYLDTLNHAFKDTDNEEIIPESRTAYLRYSQSKLPMAQTLSHYQM